MTPLVSFPVHQFRADGRHRRVALSGCIGGMASRLLRPPRHPLVPPRQRETLELETPLALTQPRVRRERCGRRTTLRAGRRSGFFRFAPLMLLLLPGMACGSDETTRRLADPFAAAAVTPRSVSFYLHLEHAAELRGRLAPLPDRSVVQRDRGGWSAPARLDESRRAGQDGAGETLRHVPWSALDGAQPRGAGRLAVGAAQRGGSCRQSGALPAAAASPPWAPRRHSRRRIPGGRAAAGPARLAAHRRSGRGADLFYEVLEHLAGERPVGESLASDPAVARAGELGFGQAGVLLRHAPPLGGCSTAVARLEADQIEVRQAGRYESAPLSRPVTALRCDFSPLAALERKNLIAMMEPADVGGGLLEAYVATVIGEPLITEELARHLGPRRIIVIGDVEGRTLEQPVDVLSTTLAVCLELKQDQDLSQATGPTRSAGAEVDEQTQRAGRRRVLHRAAGDRRRVHCGCSRDRPPSGRGMADRWSSRRAESRPDLDRRERPPRRLVRDRHRPPAPEGRRREPGRSRD